MLRVDTSVRQQFTELSAQLRSARRAAGLPQRTLAARLRVSNTSLADWESGRDDPTMVHLIWWATELGFRIAIVDPSRSPALPALELDDGESWEQHEMRRLAAALWTRRRSRKMSQTTLAARIGVGRISMQRWESAQVFPRPIAFMAWVTALGCSITLHENDTAADATAAEAAAAAAAITSDRRTPPVAQTAGNRAYQRPVTHRRDTTTATPHPGR